MLHQLFVFSAAFKVGQEARLGLGRGGRQEGRRSLARLRGPCTRSSLLSAHLGGHLQLILPMPEGRTGQQWGRDTPAQASWLQHSSCQPRVPSCQPGLAPPTKAASSTPGLMTPPHHAACWASLMIPIWLSSGAKNKNHPGWGGGCSVARGRGVKDATQLPTSSASPAVPAAHGSSPGPGSVLAQC